ncbi:MAG: hypothetical protein F6J93_38015 [Oscillatoria sp. SIO1A7]|nr:hypothetical protein [Oscillatoria sp. SIO1A7]
MKGILISLIVTSLTSIVFWSPTGLAQEPRRQQLNRGLLAQNLGSPLEIRETLPPILQVGEVGEVREVSQGNSTLHRQTGEEQPFRPQRVPFRPRTNPQKKPTASASPGITIMTPSGYGASWGSAGLGLGLQERTRFTNNSDGVLGMGIGLGNARKSVGLSVGITVTDLLGNSFADGTMSLKLHRQLPENFGIAAGWQGALRWGETDGGSSVYGAISKRFVLKKSASEPFSQLSLSFGVGNGQYRSENNIQNNRDSVGVFGSVALRVAEPASAIVEWTGQDMTVGLSVAPFRNLPLVVSPAVTDITGSAGDGARFIFGIGYGFSFR